MIFKALRCLLELKCMFKPSNKLRFKNPKGKEELENNNSSLSLTFQNI